MSKLTDFNSRHLGAHLFISVISEYMECFTSRSISYTSRVEKLAFVVGFVRYWNKSLTATASLSQASNGLTSETCCDIELSVASFITVLATFGDFNLKAEFDPEKMV